jgi:hypothetical protein
MILDKRRLKGANITSEKMIAAKLCNKVLSKTNLDIKKIKIDIATVIP